MKLPLLAVLIVFGVLGCGQSDQDLCSDVQDKLVQCGTLPPSTCPETLETSVRNQYECIVETPCQEISKECS